MKVKLEWLNELVDLSGLTVSEIVNTLGLYSIEVEGVEKVIEGTNLVIGHVESKTPHPDSDHLNICMVNTGSEVLQIVCGAPNVETGQNIILAMEGAVLPGGFKIKKSKIRGVESNGMICSLGELGMEKKYVSEEYANGIYWFKDDVELGSNPIEKLNLADEVIELGLTPNRGDLLSMLGVAYEVSAVFNRPMKPLAYELKEGLGKTNVDVVVETDKCPVYFAKRYSGLVIKPSPQWLQARLIAFGVRPINNVVDITNYIMALFGQPLHAFDAGKLGNKIVVRQAYEGEKIITLDSIERTLESSDIVITDGVKPVAIAGVMGGLDSGIDENTTEMVLETAVFDPKSIRITSTKLGLRSEASIRYEKGVDIARCQKAIEYTTYLLETYADAESSSDYVMAGSDEVHKKEVLITAEYISNYLGIEISKDEVVDILSKLQLETVVSGEEVKVIVPTRRPDITIKQDIVEEVARIHGYDKLPTTLTKTKSAGHLTNYQARRRKLKHTLVGLGLTENVTYSLLENDDDFKYMFKEGTERIDLMYPISSERSSLRRSLSKSLLESVSYCFNRKIKNIAAFEIGKVYYKENGAYCEEENLVITMANSFTSTPWKGVNENVDFYVIKGVLEEAFSALDVTFEFKTLDKEFKEMHPLRTAVVLYNGKEVGYVGELHPKYAKENDLKDVYIAEIKIQELLNIELGTKIYSQISKVPSVERDIAIVINKDIPANNIINAIKDTDKNTLSSVTIFDIYQGEKIAVDEKSIAIKLVFTSLETLTDEVINNKVNKILKQLNKNFNATLRS